MNAPQQSSPASYSDKAACQQYLRRVLDTTLNQGLINHHNNGGSSVNGLTLESSKSTKDPTVNFLTSPYSDGAAFWQYLKRVTSES